MTRTGIGRLALLLGGTLCVAACQQGTQPFGFLKGRPQGDVTAGASAPAGPSERDVEAPEVFNLSDTGLWDGRPSLGGVWVAHGSVKEPERVMIRNPANGRSVVGALFRREFDNPGPRLQVSSDAAEALGLTAGQPQKLDVVALKREEVTPSLPIADDMPAETAPAETAAADGIQQKPLEPVAAQAAAAIAKAEAAAPAPAPAATAPAAPPGKAAATPGTTVKVTAGPAAAAKPAAAAATGTLKRPFVQVGIFSVEANAGKAADQLAKAGLPSQVKADQSNGKSFWRVIVGPAASEADRGTLAAKVKGLGYPDAYPVSK